MRLLYIVYRVYLDFIQHPEFRGPSFNWAFPLRHAINLWQATRED